MHITITGNLGSGKSTVCKILQKDHGFQVYSTGSIQRELARSLNISTLEMNQLMRQDIKYDHMIDDGVRKLSQEKLGERVLFDSRLAWYFVPRSFKVFIRVDIDIAADRVFNDDRGAEERYQNHNEAKSLLEARATEEAVRYAEIYKLDYSDFAHFDLVLDSSYCPPEMIADLIIQGATKYYSTGCPKQILLSPRNLYPTQNFRNTDGEKLKHYIAEYREVKYYPDTTIDVLKYQNDYFILNGHHRVMAAIKNDIPFVQVNILSKRGEDIVVGKITVKDYLSDLSRTIIYDHENACGFEFKKHPEVYSQ